MKIKVTNKHIDEASTEVYKDPLKNCMVATALKDYFSDNEIESVGIYYATVKGVTYQLPEDVSDKIEDFMCWAMEDGDRPQPFEFELKDVYFRQN